MRQLHSPPHAPRPQGETVANFYCGDSRNSKESPPGRGWWLLLETVDASVAQKPQLLMNGNGFVGNGVLAIMPWLWLWLWLRLWPCRCQHGKGDDDEDDDVDVDTVQIS